MVCRGLAKAFGRAGIDLRLCDLRPTLAYDDLDELARVPDNEALYYQQRLGQGDHTPLEAPGVGLLFGFPAWTPYVPRHDVMIGYHVCNTTLVPDSWVQVMNSEDLVFTPSEWCAKQFKATGVETPIEVVYHGIGEEMRPPGQRRGNSRPWMRHFASESSTARKGTIELIEAYARIRAPQHKLAIHSTDDVTMQVAQRIVMDERKDLVGSLVVHTTPPRFPEDMAQLLWDTAGLLQPSRAEGFGIIPLEARACGVPVMMTGCTGHAEHVRSCNGDGVLEVLTGELAPCPSDIQLAPSLDPEALLAALVQFDQQLDVYSRELDHDAVVRLQALWSWDAVAVPAVLAIRARL